MKKHIGRHAFIGLLLLAPIHGALAGSTEYKIRVDGLACPFCAYGIEKKFNKIDGVESTHVDLAKGIVTVKTHDVKLEDAQLKKLFEDAGFTYRGKQESTK